MNEKPLKFYNMVVHLIQKDRIYEENAAVKNVWEKDGNTLFDIYFYRNRRSYVFDSAFIRDLVDLTTEKYYKNPQEFLRDFRASAEFENAAEDKEKNTPPVDGKMFEPLKTDLIIMIFMASCANGMSRIKEKIIYDYLTARIPASKNFSRQYISDYLNNIAPQERDFYEALDNIKSKHPDEAEELVRETVKICMSDGKLQYEEKKYLAEIFQVLREQGANPEVGL